MHLLYTSYLQENEIQLPKAVTDLLELREKEFMSVLQDKDKIVIMKNPPTCELCTVMENVEQIRIRGLTCNVCTDCITKLKEKE